MARTGRWLLAAAPPLVLAACTSPGSASPVSGTGAGGEGAGSGPAAEMRIGLASSIVNTDIINQY